MESQLTKMKDSLRNQMSNISLQVDNVMYCSL